MLKTCLQNTFSKEKPIFSCHTVAAHCEIFLLMSTSGDPAMCLLFSRCTYFSVHTLSFPLRVQSSADFSAYVLLCLSSHPAFPPPLVTFPSHQSFLMDDQSHACVLCGSCAGEFGLCDFSCQDRLFFPQPLGNRSSITNTNSRKKI